LKPSIEPRAAAAPVPATLDRASFGKRLRQTRNQLGWPLQRVADASGVSVTTISRAERGQIALGYDNISALSHALNMDMGALFSAEREKVAPFEGPVVTRAGAGVMYDGLTVSYEFLSTTAPGKQMSPVIATINLRKITSQAEFVRHDGEEFIYVVSGKLEAHFETGKVVKLSRGDSMYFDSRVGHAYISTGRQLARIVGVMTEMNADARRMR
jgi:transcriptional regulator with XRE-family HTH domain